MAKKYYVIDGENNTVWQGKERDDAPQVFSSFAAAERRAKAAAETEPGVEYKIVGVEAIACCDVSRAKVRKVS